MNVAVVLRSINAVTGIILIGLIVRAVLEQRRRGIHDIFQDWRFTGLAIYTMLPATAIFDKLNAPLTLRTWFVPLATIASSIGVLGLRREQRQNPPPEGPP